jgi:predicted nucleic acid-binding protein
VIGIDTSVSVKWFKGGERYDAEAQDLRGRLERREIEAAANEILGLEVVRGLKNAQVRLPLLGITNADIEAVYDLVEGMFRTGILLERPVAEVKTQAKEFEIQLGLFMADALHLVTAVYLRVQQFVVDDHHLLAPAVVRHAASVGVQVCDLPTLIAVLAPPGGSGSQP